MPPGPVPGAVKKREERGKDGDDSDPGGGQLCRQHLVHQPAGRSDRQAETKTAALPADRPRWTRPGPDSRYIYLIGSDNIWLEAALQSCNQAGLYPILLCNQAYHTFDADYSTVCLDVVNSMRRLVEILSARGLSRVALYGVNPQSVSDEARGGGLPHRPGAGRAPAREKATCFSTTARWKTALRSFCAAAAEYDAAICVNEFAAVSLARRLARRDRSGRRAC